MHRFDKKKTSQALGGEEVKLLRFGAIGHERPGILGPEGEIRDLTGVVEDIAGDVLSDSSLDRLRGIDPCTLPAAPADHRIGPPVGQVPKFIAIGRNYADHAKETGSDIPDEPILFTKATSCISGPNDDVVLPSSASKGDWEVELALVIGKRAQDIAESEALDHIAGYCVCNDVSERGMQFEGTGQWLKGKSRDSWGPLGPWLVTQDEVPDPQRLELWLELNGERHQSGNTSNMIFPVATLVSFISHHMTLHPGDVVTTGTPDGVGMGHNPPRFLRAGDELRLGIEGLGEQRQMVVVR